MLTHQVLLGQEAGGAWSASYRAVLSPDFSPGLAQGLCFRSIRAL
jgi:hypothetical protein